MAFDWKHDISQSINRLQDVPSHSVIQSDHQDRKLRRGKSSPSPTSVSNAARRYLAQLSSLIHLAGVDVIIAIHYKEDVSCYTQCRADVVHLAKIASSRIKNVVATIRIRVTHVIIMVRSRTGTAPPSSKDCKITTQATVLHRVPRTVCRIVAPVRKRAAIHYTVHLPDIQIRGTTSRVPPFGPPSQPVPLPSQEVASPPSSLIDNSNRDKSQSVVNISTQNNSYDRSMPLHSITPRIALDHKNISCTNVDTK